MERERGRSWGKGGRLGGVEYEAYKIENTVDANHAGGVREGPTFKREGPTFNLRDLPLNVKDLPLNVRDLPLNVRDLPLTVRDLPSNVRDIPLKGTYTNLHM